MPTIRYIRTWCNSCKDFTLHKKHIESNLKCRDCGNEGESYSISDIPEDKYTEQIDRWKVSRTKSIAGKYMTYLNMMGGNPFRENPDIDIVEDDLGYEKTERQFNEKVKSERDEKRAEQERLKNLYRGLTRNDKCGCGSGVKFKNCCLSKINEIIH